MSPRDVTCSQSHSSCFDHLNKNWWEVHSLKLLIMQFSPFPCHLFPLKPKFLPQLPILILLY
jgi:hypothetical protein